MLWSGRITLVVMTSAIVLTHSSAEEEPIRKLRSTFLSPLVSERHPEGNYIRHYKTRNGKEATYRLKTRRTWDVEPVIVKLNNVYDKYEFIWEEVKALYAPVEPCVPDKCGKKHSKVPRNLLPKRFKCAKFKKYKFLKEKSAKIISRFHSGVQYFLGKFQRLSSLQKMNSGRRLKILNELKNELRMLNLEIETLLTKKRLKTVRKRLTKIPPPTPSGASRTSLLIKEWPILQNYKKFLEVWKENLGDVSSCWSKTQPRFLTLSYLHHGTGTIA